jgi:hypothetical protein
MRFISTIDHHPEVRKERFPPHLWPSETSEKDLDECWILLEFLTAAGIHPDSAPRKLAVPMPDLECVIKGQQTFFELGEILESDLAEGLAFSGKQSNKKAGALAAGDLDTANSIPTAGFRSYPANAALDRMLQRKLRNKYPTQDLPTHLVLFYDCQPPWGPFDYLLQMPDELASLIARSSFQTVWIFYLPAMAVIGRLDVLDEILEARFDWSFHFDSTEPIELPPADGDFETRRFAPILVPARRSR